MLISTKEQGSESESLNLNPQLFLNQVLNNLDLLLDEAFTFFYQDASTKLNIEPDSQSSHDLRKGVDCVVEKVESVLNKHLSIWEGYSLRHCFAVPQGFVMPNTDESSENGSLHPDAPFDPDLDAQLDSLRKKLSEVGKESEVLNQEIQALERAERQSSLNSGYINEAMQLYEQNSLLFQEMMTAASELRTKVKKLKTGMIEEAEEMKTKRIHSKEMDLSAINPSKGLSNAKLEDLQEILIAMKSM